MGKRTWTKEEETILKELCQSGVKYQEIADKLCKSIGSINDKIRRMGYMDGIVKPNNPLFKAIYQDYDWCYDRYVLKGMKHEEMAKESNASKRVIQKWCVEIHKIHGDSFKELYKLNDIQKQLIISGTLGDGHIDRRVDQPMYIECHADDEKDYMFWKYDILKNMCNKPPVYKAENIIKHFGDKEYLCRPSYRLNSRIVDDLKSIRSMSIIEKISNLNELGFSTYILDDGHRSDSNWSLCVAKFNKEEREYFVERCSKIFGLTCWVQKDDRYINFDSNSSRKLDEIILENIPNNLDIIHKKILDKKLCVENNYIIVITEDKKLGLSYYYRNKGSWDTYEEIRNILRKRNQKEITFEKLQRLDLEVKNGQIQQLS